MLKLLIAVTFLFCICCCGKVKNEPVRIIQTDSFSSALVIQVNRFGTYYVYIANESDRYQYALLLNQKSNNWRLYMESQTF